MGNLFECLTGVPKLQQKTVTPSNSVQNVTPDSEYDGLSKVVVNAIPAVTSRRYVLTPTHIGNRVYQCSCTHIPNYTTLTVDNFNLVNSYISLELDTRSSSGWQGGLVGIRNISYTPSTGIYQYEVYIDGFSMWNGSIGSRIKDPISITPICFR